MRNSLSSIKFVMILLTAFLLISCAKENENFNKEKENIEESAIELTSMFERVPSSETSITFKNKIIENRDINYFKYEYIYNGGGVAAGDINNDGLPDLLFTANMGLNRLYLNKGDFKFEQITNSAGIKTVNDWVTGVTFADVNGDGWLDIYLCKSGWFTDPEMRRNLLFINNKDLTFTESSKAYGLDDPGYSTQATFFDFDNDNDLDVFVGNHPINFNTIFGKALEKRKNPPLYSSDQFYRNDSGKFTNISKKAGINNHGHTLGIVAADYNQDGFEDIYVSNDYLEHDFLYENNGNGTFTEVSKEKFNHLPKFSMGVDAADINNDGLLDIIAMEMLGANNKRQKTNMAAMNPEIFNLFKEEGFHSQFMHNCLQLNNGNGSFSEIAYLAGVAATDWSWSPLFADFDNDGWKDLFITNGYKRDVLNKDVVQQVEQKRQKGVQAFVEVQNQIPTTQVENLIFKNNGNLTFQKSNNLWMSGIGAFNSNGAIYSDLDGDGALDLIVNQMDGEAVVLKNNARKLNSSNNYVQFSLQGPKGNLNAIGAIVSIMGTNGIQIQHLTLTRGFQSAVDAIIHFGLGKENSVDEVLVYWPNGFIQEIANVKINSVNEISFDKEKSKKGNYIPPGNAPLFESVPIASKTPTHKEMVFDDYKKQVLLPHKLSQLGPGIAVGDLNGDELDDFYLGGAAGQSGQLFVQTNNQKFSAKQVLAFNKDKFAEDMGVLFFDCDGDKDLDLYVVSGSYEKQEKEQDQKDRLYINDGKANFTKSSGLIDGSAISGSCITAADFDNDGDLDIFVGGRLIPGKYPLSPSSQLYRNDQGKFNLVNAELAPMLEDIGMVTSAIWTDINDDGSMDLIIVGEWMEIKVLIQENGKFADRSYEMGLEFSGGWWNSIVGGDIDNDGDTDYVIGNLGLNSKNKVIDGQPFRVFGKDFDQNGSVDIALGYFENGICYPVRGLQCSSEQIPTIKKKFSSYSIFGDATIESIYGQEELSTATKFDVHQFESMVLLNQNGKSFKKIKLPEIAQISPTNGMILEDIDGDALLDLLLVGNFYPVEVETGRYDAHKGLFLKGQGNGKFKDLGRITSNLKLNGDAKGIALIGLGTEKKAAFLITQNDGDLVMLQSKKSFQLKAITDKTGTHNLPSNKSRKVERYYGSGYLSQSGNYSRAY